MIIFLCIHLSPLEKIEAKEFLIIFWLRSDHVLKTNFVPVSMTQPERCSCLLNLEKKWSNRSQTLNPLPEFGEEIRQWDESSSVPSVPIPLPTSEVIALGKRISKKLAMLWWIEVRKFSINIWALGTTESAVVGSIRRCLKAQLYSPVYSRMKIKGPAKLNCGLDGVIKIMMP